MPLSQNQIANILNQCRVIAVIGVSDDSTKPSFQVTSYLKRCGYRIVPVNPNANTILGEKSYSSLQAIPPRITETIDIVDVFRRSEDVPPVMEQVIELKRRFGYLSAVWMPQGIINEPAAELARQAGLVVVVDNCLMLAHRDSKIFSAKP